MRLRILLLMLLVLSIFAACGKEQKEEKYKGPKIGLVLSTGGLGDGSFNDSAYTGLMKAKEELGIEFNYVEPANPTEMESFIRDYAEAGYDLVITVGFYMVDPLKSAAPDYPKVDFAIIDGYVEGENIAMLNFSEVEGSFLAGALAALETKTNKVGFIGGMEIPLIRKFQKGYEMGAKYINKEVEVISAYVGGGNPFADPVRAKELAISQNANGVDIIFHASGASGSGIFEGGKERGFYAIGVDSNQDDMAKGVVLTSMLKRVDIATYNLVKEYLDGKFMTGQNVFGVAQEGVMLTDFKNTKDILKAGTLERIEEVKQGIIEGSIEIKE